MIPKIDSDIGISLYSTSFPGCGGIIKEKPEDFQVFELISNSAEKAINQNQDGYAVFKLTKQQIDTNHALNLIFKKNHLRLKALGLKDAKGNTQQFVCSMNKTHPPEKFSDKKFSLERIGYVKKPLTKKDMIGNRFKIKIINSSKDFSEFDDYNKILNFYGYQRFGSKRAVTHLIGKAILERDFNKAIQILLCTTSPYDSKENNEIREKLEDPTNFKKTFDEIPPQMDLERIVVKKMIESSNSLLAIKALPLFMRRFFLQAFQSYIFNKTLSLSFESGEDMLSSKDGDVCFDKKNQLGKFMKDPNQKLAIPMVGYSYYKKTRFDFYISKLLEFENLALKDFFIKEMQESSLEGGFRNSKLECTDFKVEDNWVSFILSRGSYATIVLREIMKPEDPLAAGF